MTKPKFGARAGRRAELRKAQDRVLDYLVSPNGRDREQFEEYDDKTLSNSLLGVMLRELADYHPKGTDYLVSGEWRNQVTVSPEALSTALRDLKKVHDDKKAVCKHCGRGPEQRRAA